MSTGPEKNVIEASELAATDSVPRRASMLVKIITTLIVAIGIVWFFSALQEREVPLPEESVSENQAAAYGVFEPVVEGAQIYTLGGVEFIFETQEASEGGTPSTRVRLQLNDFKRGSVPVEVGRYRLGTYRGTCSTESVAQGALLRAKCSYQGLVRQLGVFQEGRHIVVKTQSSFEAESLGGFVPILTIDVTKIVE